MNVTHLYLKKGRTVAEAVHIVKHTFTGAGAPTVERFSKSFSEQAAWLAEELAKPNVKAVYVCAGCCAKKPDTYTGPWLPVIPGSPLENI